MDIPEADGVFEKTAIKAEQLLQTHPMRYKFTLLLYALLGYLAIFALLAVLSGLVGGMIGMAFVSTGLFILLLKKKLIFVLLPLIWVLLKSLWVKIYPPTGYVLNAKQYPVLFAEIAALRRRLQTPKIHQVILTSAFNAGVTRTPRLGIFGWYKNTLILGMELLLCLPPEQARAVLAHEFGHLSRNHSRFSAWIYRVRITWHRLMLAFQNDDSLGARLSRRFFEWYAPRFSAYSFALARAHEYQADAISAELTSPQAAGQALINTHASEPYLNENYWQAFFQSADDQAQPACLPWAGLSVFLRDHPPARAQLLEKLEEALQQKTGYSDTHPALKERVAALRAPLELPSADGLSAAQVWLGSGLQTILQDFDQEWLSANAERWQLRYQYAQDSRRSLTELGLKTPEQLSDEELWRYAQLSEEFVGEEQAYVLFESYQARYPDDPDAAFALGKILFKRKDDGLLAQMRKALALPGLVDDACRYAYLHLTAQGRQEEAAWWRNKALEHARITQESEAERATLSLKDSLMKPDISEEMRQQILDAIQDHGKIKKVWIAQKKLKHYPDVPALAIVVVARGWWQSSEKVAGQLEADLKLACTLYVVPKSGDYKKLAKKIIKAGELLFKS